MHHKFRNVNDAFRGLVDGFYTGKIHTEVLPSRYGEVAQVLEPVIVTYRRPLERVLFNQARDANPFLHLFESLWMLAGRNDVAPLAYYCSRMREFSDDGKTFNGAYGYRWRYGVCGVGKTWVDDGDQITTDQLKRVINHLKAKPESRRAVLQMWNVEDDLLKIDASKDTCCNLSCLFSIEQGNCLLCDGKGWYKAVMSNAGIECSRCDGKPHDQPRFLNMTVFNRSNDMIWGMLGANVVHFSVLQEYVAAHLKLEVGAYHQITNNLHAYTKTWEPEKWLADKGGDGWANYGEDLGIKPFPLVKDPATFDKEIPEFVERHSSGERMLDPGDYSEPFLQEVAQPMMIAFHCHKVRDYHGAFSCVDGIEADDWRIAARNWIRKRSEKYEGRRKGEKSSQLPSSGGQPLQDQD